MRFTWIRDLARFENQGNPPRERFSGVIFFFQVKSEIIEKVTLCLTSLHVSWSGFPSTSSRVFIMVFTPVVICGMLAIVEKAPLMLNVVTAFTCPLVWVRSQWDSDGREPWQ